MDNISEESSALPQQSKPNTSKARQQERLHVMLKQNLQRRKMQQQEREKEPG